MKLKIVAAFTLMSLVSTAQTDQEQVLETVNQPTIKSHLGFLASDVLKGRDTPSPEQDIAAEYIKSRFVEYGVKIAEGTPSYFQDVPFKKISVPTDASISIAENQFELNVDFLVMNDVNIELDGQLVFVGYGGKDELDKKNIKGKIVVALCGDGISQSPRAWFKMSESKKLDVEQRGGIALIELFSSNQLPWKILSRFLGGEKIMLDKGNSLIPHVWMNRTEEDIGRKKQRGSISIKGVEKSLFASKNIVGIVEGTDESLKNEFVVYSAHYDHVGVGQADSEGDSIYNGARDNAVGTVTVLSAAQNIAKYPTKRSAMFVLFTGEEKGLLGSEYFVENSPIELSKIVFCFNSDNGGYNDTTVATITGLTRTSAQGLIEQACASSGLKAIEDPAPEQNLFDRSDNVNFAKNGIPAPSFGLGFSSFDAELLKHYHKPSDETASLDFNYLEKFFKAYVLSCRMIANSDKTPFWIEGDKYYDAGISLYKK